MFIAGAGVASGYVGQPELTAERFSPDPFVPDGGSMYDTGDLVRWLPDGTIEYLGRQKQVRKAWLGVGSSPSSGIRRQGPWGLSATR